MATDPSIQCLVDLQRVAERLHAIDEGLAAELADALCTARDWVTQEQVLQAVEEGIDAGNESPAGEAVPTCSPDSSNPSPAGAHPYDEIEELYRRDQEQNAWENTTPSHRGGRSR